jgi:hypothetical protein
MLPLFFISVGKLESWKVESWKVGKLESWKVESGKVGKFESRKFESRKFESRKFESGKVESLKVESLKVESWKVETMNNNLTINEVEEKIIPIRETKVILDSDVAALYGVETKRINEAVKNNPDKFPEGYIIELEEKEVQNLRSKFSTTNLNMTRVTPKAFTEKGLYMLATILKSPKATQTTLSIIETFATFRELTRTINAINTTASPEKQKELMNQTGELMSDLLGNELSVSDTETTIELNFAIVKLKHTVKRKI